jgi:ABC-2 type transport system ATP-binding protein
MSTPVVTFEQVSKRYKYFQALDGLSFSLYPGEVFGYIGPNGAGKTTTLKLISGLLREFTGHIRVYGQDLPQGYDTLHTLIGFLPQSPGFANWRTVEQTLDFLGQLSGVPEADRAARITQWLTRFDLLPARHKKIKQLSGGMLQKVGFVQALLHNPRLVVLDEPLNNLDPAARDQVKQVIRELKSAGVTIIFSSHILSDVEDVADRIGIIQAGRMQFEGTVPELKLHFGVPNDIQLEFAQAPTDTSYLRAHPGVLAVTDRGGDRYLLQLSKEAPFDEIVHQVVTDTLAQGGRIRLIGNITPSLDELYVRYFEQQKTTPRA